MNEIIAHESDSLSIEPEQNVMPTPMEGKELYITEQTKGVDFHALLGHILQCVNMADILEKIKDVAKFNENY